MGQVSRQLVPCTDGAAGMARLRVLQRVMWRARICAGEICSGKGQALLADAALCFYWAERDCQEAEDQALNMQRYLSTLTSLLDLYAAPGLDPQPSTLNLDLSAVPGPLKPQPRILKPKFKAQYRDWVRVRPLNGIAKRQKGELKGRRGAYSAVCVSAVGCVRVHTHTHT